VKKAREAAVVDHDGRVLLGNTEGMTVGYRYSRALAYVDVAAEENGASQVGHHAEFSLSPAGLDPSTIGKEAARKATAKLGSRPARTGRVPAVIHREVVMGLVDAIGAIFSARRVLKGTSLLANRVGEKVASAALSLVDDPRLPGGYGSAPADGEGLPTQRTTLLEAGVLRGFLHDSFSARKMPPALAGNSIRSSYSTPPQIAPMNPLVLPGADSLDTLLARAGNGVYVTEVMGLHTIDPISGDFSLGGCGQVIRSGRLVEPVDRFAISGNLLDLLASVEEVGADLWLSPGGGGAPSLLVGGVSIAGGA
jgi:PmbA protein